MRVLVAALLLAACGADQPPSGAGGSAGNSHLGGSSGGGTGGTGGVDPGNDNCIDAAKLVYVLDQFGRISSFKPDTLTFTDIGPLRCPAPGGAQPFSMAVDRSAIAWVVYTTGELFRVDTRDASCMPTSYQVNQQGFEVFGMGFASNAPGSNEETLYIAGGALSNYYSHLGPVQLGSLSFPGLSAGTIAPFSDWAEMTGTGDAKLWAYFGHTSPPHVAQIDKVTGTESNIYQIMQPLGGTGSGFAFAFWGGDFWIFDLPQQTASTNVYRYRPSNSSLMEMLPNTGRHIVGAGVSTCAPIVVP